MSEETKIGRDMDGLSGESRHAALIERVIVGGLVIGAGMLAVYALLYFGFGIRPLLLNGVGVLLGLACLGAAFWLVRQEQLDIAVYLVLAALLLVYGFSELTWSGETLYNLVGGLLLIVVLGSLLLRRRWYVWLAAAGAYAIGVLAINVLPVERADVITEAPAVYYLDLGATVLLALVALRLFIRFIATNTIRVRLLAAFVSLILAPAVVISAVTAVVGFRSGQQQAFERLELVADLNEKELTDWSEDLQTSIAGVLLEPGIFDFVEIVLRPDFVTTGTGIYSELEGYLANYLQRMQQVEGLFIVDLEGETIVATDLAPKTFAHAEQVYFTEGVKGPSTVVVSDSDISERLLVIASRPVRNAAEEVIGVIVGYVSADELEAIAAQQAGLGETGEVLLVTSDGLLLARSGPGEVGISVQAEGVTAAIESQSSGRGLYTDFAGRDVVGVYRWVHRFRIALLVEQQQTEVFASLYGTLVLNIGVSLILVVFAGGAALLVTRSIATPLTELAETASQVASGDLDRGDLERHIPLKRTDEVGALARAFGNMTAQLRDLIGSLEDRVTARTVELEKRSIYLQASAEVARAVSSILDAEQLIQQVVELIRRRFDLYYVGLFLVGEGGSVARAGDQWAVLRAGTGEAGQVMLARGHRIKVGEGMIGWCIANAQARIASDVGEDGVRLATEELPATRSEAALPLRTHNRVIGALTVQSAQPNAFDQETLAVFQMMVDQVAIALENARLFAESQAALEAASRAYGELSREAWAQLLQSQPDMGYRSDERGVSSWDGTWRPEMLQAWRAGGIARGNGVGEADRVPLAVPIKVRGEVIGVLDTYKPAEEGEWTPEELSLLEALADQLGEALEGARLYRDTQRRAARERLTAEIVGRIRETLDMETVLKTAAQELRQSLKLPEVTVRLAAGRRGDGKDDV